ncbi:PLP-dependent aminotransferase family protein [Nesterenkonia populi]
MVEELRSWAEQAPAGARLPSTRALVAEHGVSPVTVQKALRQLVSAGLVESRPGVGNFVRALRAPAPQDYSWQTAALGPRSGSRGLASALRSISGNHIDLGSGFPAPELVPDRLVRTALTRAARSRAVVNWPSAEGLPDLRAWFASELAEEMQAGLAPPRENDVLIFPGSQPGLGACFRALVGAGQPLLIESPTYWGAILAAQQSGVQMVPVPISGEGPDPEEVDRAFQRSGARVLYAQPNYTNPTGTQWSAERRSAILDVIRRNGAFLIEDNWARDFDTDSHPQSVAAEDEAGHVVHIRSLTKSVSPAIRVAAVMARGPARERLLAAAQAETIYVSGVLQAAALDVVTQPAWRTHLRGVAQQLRSRRTMLLQALQAHAPQVEVAHVPRGAFHLWVRLPDGVAAEPFAQQLAAAGVGVVPGDELFPAEPTGAHLRLTYAGPAPEKYEEAAQIIGHLLTRWA